MGFIEDQAKIDQLKIDAENIRRFKEAGNPMFEKKHNRTGITVTPLKMRKEKRRKMPNWQRKAKKS